MQRSEDVQAGETSPLLSRHPSGASDHPSTSPSQPERSTTRVVATMLSFAVLGLFTSTTGVLLPHLEHDYDLSDAKASLIFLAVPIPYLLAAQLNDWLHHRLGRRGIAILGPLAHAAASAGASLRPPFVAFLACFATAAFGNGLLDASWATWAATRQNPNFISGLLHGAFSAGAAAGPAIAGLVISTEKGSWYAWYHYLAGASIVELAVLAWAFRTDDAASYEKLDDRDADVDEPKRRGISRVLCYGSAWMCAVYLLMYVGTESSISGWIVVFMTRARNVRPSLANLCSTGFWAGMAVGRAALGPVTERTGIRRGVVLYLGLAMATGVIFAAVENLVISILLLALIGAFCGPLFPSSIVYLASVIPSDLHVAAVSFVSSVGQVGGAGLPALLGLISEAVGIRAFQAVIMGQLVMTLVCWILLTSGASKGSREPESSSTSGL